MHGGKSDENADDNSDHALTALTITDKKVIACDYECHHRSKGKQLLELNLDAGQNSLNIAIGKLRQR